METCLDTNALAGREAIGFVVGRVASKTNAAKERRLETRAFELRFRATVDRRFFHAGVKTPATFTLPLF